ncbi:MAG: hypothetical protein E6G92_13270 [Alphaproteobacteria bacterium]|nr:MAG: hypothetical protein E6G92_13270 [Alphaproteobacteria bacterium]
MNFKTIFLLAVGFGLMSLSHSLELRGDLAPFVKDGVSAERAQYHLMALAALLGAMGCFVYSGVRIFRRIRDGY